MIRYCRKCVMPETKPDIFFDEHGICAACRSYADRDEVDWDQRRSELDVILGRYAQGGARYDCIVPVSGGKDSHFQVISVLELGLRPLCVTATTDHLTELGRRNIENIKSLGVDYVEVTTDPKVRRRINRYALTHVGDISWPEHVTIFTVPVRLAVSMGIPLIIWGENPQNEYGGPAAAAEDQTLSRRCLEEFGGLLGLRVTDLEAEDEFTEKDLIQYQYPTDEELAASGVTGIFLGYFLPWDGWANALIAQGHGFETYPHLVEGSLANYENLDNAQTGVHDYFKFLKYGFGRATDLACMQIRRNRLPRARGVELVRRLDGKFPWSYLGVPLEEILESIEMSLPEFQAVCDRFTNSRLFVKDPDGDFVRDEMGNLEKVNYDNEP